MALGEHQTQSACEQTEGQHRGQFRNRLGDRFPDCQLQAVDPQITGGHKPCGYGDELPHGQGVSGREQEDPQPIRHIGQAACD